MKVKAGVCARSTMAGIGRVSFHAVPVNPHLNHVGLDYGDHLIRYDFMSWSDAALRGSNDKCMLQFVNESLHKVQVGGRPDDHGHTEVEGCALLCLSH